MTRYYLLVLSLVLVICNIRNTIHQKNSLFLSDIVYRYRNSVLDVVKLYATKNKEYQGEFSRRTLIKQYPLFNSTQTIDAVLFTTTHKISTKCLNTLKSFKYYKQRFNIKVLVFTESEEVRKVCTDMGILVMDIPRVNDFNLPFIGDMFIAAKKNITAQYYGYLNSDILLNPLVLMLLHPFESLVSSPSLYAGRVVVTETVPEDLHLEDPSQLDQLHNTYYKLRNYMEVDYFIYSHDFPFEKIPPVVVGRWGVDTGLMIAAHDEHVNVVDTTNIYSYHQGRDVSFNNKQNVNKKDWFWNFDYVDRNEVKYSGSLNSNFKVERNQSEKTSFLQRHFLWMKRNFLVC